GAGGLLWSAPSWPHLARSGTRYSADVSGICGFLALVHLRGNQARVSNRLAITGVPSGSAPDDGIHEVADVVQRLHLASRQMDPELLLDAEHQLHVHHAVPALDVGRRGVGAEHDGIVVENVAEDPV